VSRTPQELIASAQQHLRLLHEHLTRGDMDDATIFDAVCMRLSACFPEVPRAVQSPFVRDVSALVGTCQSALVGVQLRSILDIVAPVDG
jgi:hypothetical protein